MTARYTPTFSADEKLARQMQLSETGNTPCRYWRQGHCRDGGKCIYSHAEPPGIPSSSSASSSRPSNYTSTNPITHTSSTYVTTSRGGRGGHHNSNRHNNSSTNPISHDAANNDSNNNSAATARGGRATGRGRGRGREGGRGGHLNTPPAQQQQQPSSDMYADVDNMSYEDLLALQERVGIVKLGLRPDQMRRLPTTIIRTEPPNSADPCSICLDKISVGNTVRSLPCDHLFHVECIDEWLSEHRQCPVCKRDVALVASSVGDVLDQMLKS